MTVTETCFTEKFTVEAILAKVLIILEKIRKSRHLLVAALGTKKGQRGISVLFCL